jgi:release factor glutamine methyltransferase
MRLDEWLQSASTRLEQEGIESSRLESQALAAHVLGTDRAWVLAHGNSEATELPLENVLARRLSHEPLAYIIGSREFYGRSFQVRRGVLIPRHETEILVDAVLEQAPSPARVFEIGVGSGCVAITLKLERPDWTVVGGDVSIDALSIADSNCLELGADVLLVHTDACRGIASQAFDIVVTNPPYVSINDLLIPEIKDFEPPIALYADHDGLAFYERLSLEVLRVLRPGGLLLMELGAGQALPVQDLFHEAGWKDVKVLKDLSGLDRVLSVTSKND